MLYCSGGMLEGSGPLPAIIVGIGTGPIGVAGREPVLLLLLLLLSLLLMLVVGVLAVL